MTYKKKLIEVALPLDAINKAAAYEKLPGIGPHPRGIHLWWARRPLAAARAVIWASLVDDPSAHPDLFPDEASQNAERERLFEILEELVQWKNSNNKRVLDNAKAEILKSTDGNPPPLLDPFAGGGAIPLEAQRLGLKAYANDLNPVAVMINKAMIEIPPKFANQPPVNPEARAKIGSKSGWKGAQGLAEDVRYYGTWMKEEAFKRIGHLYPKVKDEQGIERTVIAWIWARTVKCPNPACNYDIPLVNNFMLANKKGRASYVEPTLKNGQISYKVKSGIPSVKGTMISRRGASCLNCKTMVDFNYIRENMSGYKTPLHLLAIVAESTGGKIYLSAIKEHEKIAQVNRPENIPSGDVPEKALGINIKSYGFDSFTDLFTNRQLVSISLLNELTLEASAQLLKDGATQEYADALSVFLSFAVDRCADFSNSMTRWVPSNEKVMNLFGRQTIAMTWDFPEANLLTDSVGGFIPAINYISECLLTLPVNVKEGIVRQMPAQKLVITDKVFVSTDPPYYDNIGYADLSDFFYIWLRKSLSVPFKDIFYTVQSPKIEELIANPHRHKNGMKDARVFFETGMLDAFKKINSISKHDFPITVYYAFKQIDDSDKSSAASTGWEAMLKAIVDSGFIITGTWPIRTEQATRNRSIDSNALASSVVLVCRKRSLDSQILTRREFVNHLKLELKHALKKLLDSNIAPVDMAQAAIGPGMGVYSRYAQVLEADGTPMSVRTALQIINQELDSFFNEQDGELDSASRFCVDLFTQSAFNEIRYGEADVLARAKNTSVERLAEDGVLIAEKGIVRLLTREELPDFSWAKKSMVWMLTQQLTKAMETGGYQATAKILAALPASKVEQAKALAYRLFSLADRKGWAKEAYAYNTLVSSWQSVQFTASEIAKTASEPKQINWLEQND